MSTPVEMIEALQSKWYRHARVDCDPANGSATIQAAGQRTAQLADELAPILAAARVQEKDLADAIVCRDSWHEQWKLRCGMLDKQVEITEKLEKELIGLIARIRSEALAGMREACANVIANEIRLRESTDHGLDHMRPISELEIEIRKLPDLAADEAIERIKREARLEESRSLWNQDFGDAYNGGYLTEKGRDYLRGRIAALSGKETEHE